MEALQARAPACGCMKKVRCIVVPKSGLANTGRSKHRATLTGANLDYTAAQTALALLIEGQERSGQAEQLAQPVHHNLHSKAGMLRQLRAISSCSASHRAPHA